MGPISRVVDNLVAGAKWISMVSTMLMMLLITIAVIMQAFNFPILGEIEIAQALMVLLISFSLAYVQSEKAHINIEILAEKFPASFQKIVEGINVFLTFSVCLAIGVVNLNATWKYMIAYRMTTDILSIPFYPLRFIIGIGFILWALSAFATGLQMILKGDRNYGG